MTNHASKFALGLSVAAVIAAVVANDDKAQMLLFVGLCLTAAAIAYGLGRSVGADLPPRGAGGAATSLDPADDPRGSYGPIITAAAAFVLVLGGALGSDYVIGAAVAAVVGVTIWAFDSFRTDLDPRDARNVDNRLLGPLALPVFAAILAVTLAYAFSRVLLAIDETASWVLAFIVAAAVLAIMSVIAQRVPTTKALAAVAGAGLLVVLIAGGTGAGVGEREFEHHEEGTPIVDITAKDVSFDRNVIGLPADTDVELVFTNLDVGTFHNVAVYTADEPGSPVFNGRPIAKGTATYKFRSPDPGTYRYVCDFHPTMVGEFRLTEAPAETHQAKGHE
jgi:plastocyanin